MKAAVCREFGQPLVIEDIVLGSVGQNDVHVKLKACSICHSDVSFAEFELSAQSPISNSAGETLEQAMNCGAFAEEVLVHESQLQKAPKDMPFDVASLLACGVITGYGAVAHASNLREGQHAIVIGCGGVGLNSLQGASLKGAASVIAMDLDEDKRKLALGFGATHSIDPRDADAVDGQ